MCCVDVAFLLLFMGMGQMDFMVFDSEGKLRVVHAFVTASPVHTFLLKSIKLLSSNKGRG